MLKDKIIPVVYGTWGLKGASGRESISLAFRSGYYAVDTASTYGTEDMAFQEITSSVSRKNFKVITKIASKDLKKNNVNKHVDILRRKYNVDYVDVVLLHFPYENQYLDVWAQFLDIKNSGIANKIGIANMQPYHFEKLKSIYSELPDINQIEIHPMKPECKLVKYFKERKITLMAHTALGQMHGSIVNNPVLIRLSKKYSVEIDHLILSWHANRGIVPVVNSSRYDRIKNMASLKYVELESSDINLISSALQYRKFYFESKFAPGY